jgi:hypothetical protein
MIKKVEVIFNGSTFRILRTTANHVFRVIPYSNGGFEIREVVLGQPSNLVAIFSSEYSFIIDYGNQSN